MVLDVADGGHGPVAVAAVPLQVDLLRRVRAVLLHRALEAPGRRPLGLLLPPEVVEPAKGLDLGAPHVAHPEHDEVDVVAALGQQREAALPLVPPVAPDEAVRKVPEEDGLGVVDDDDLAEGAARDDLPDLDGGREVAEDVAHRHDGVVPLAGPSCRATSDEAHG